MTRQPGEHRYEYQARLRDGSQWHAGCLYAVDPVHVRIKLLEQLPPGAWLIHARPIRRGLWSRLKAWPAARWIALASAIIAICAFVVSVIHIRGLLQYQESTQRAWVVVTEIATNEDIAPSRPFWIKVYYKNVGQSPATVRLFTRVEWGPTLLPTHFNYSEAGEKTVEEKSIQVLGPGTPAFVTFKLSDLSEATITAIQNGTYHLYVHGIFDYTDGFNTPRRTGFCAHYQYRPELSEGPFNACTVHNYAY
jgi:hypothetical protein